MTGDCCVFKFPRQRADGKHLVRFQSGKAVFKFLWRSVEGGFIKLQLKEVSFSCQFNQLTIFLSRLCLHIIHQEVSASCCWIDLCEPN